MNVDPTNVKALEQEARRLLELGRHEEALSYVEQTILLDPENIGGYTNKAMVLIALQRYTDAIQACNQSLQLAPDDPVGLLNKSAALMHLRQFEETVNLCNRIISLNPQEKILLFAYINKFVALASMQATAEAAEAYSHIQYHPDALRIVQTLQRALREQTSSTGKLE